MARQGLFRLVAAQADSGDPHAPKAVDRPTLPEMTVGRIPFDLPYHVHELPNGHREVAFRRLTEAEEARLHRDTGSQLARLKDGRHVFRLPRLPAFRPDTLHGRVVPARLRAAVFVGGGLPSP